MSTRRITVLTVAVAALYCLFSAAVAQEPEPPAAPEVNVTAEGVLDFLGTDTDALYRAAVAAHGDKQYETAARYYIGLLKSDCGNMTALYNLACCYSMLGEPGLAADCLLAAADAGFRDTWQIGNDGEFDPVRETDEFKGALEEIVRGIEDLDLMAGELLFFKSPVYLPCRVQFPDNFDPRKDYILLVGLHGYGSYPSRFINLWDRFSGHDFIYAALQAPYGFNSGLEDPGYSWGWWTDAYALPQNSWDLSADYIADAIDQLQNMYKVSDTYVLGFSQGAAMSYFVGMRNPGLVNGIIPFGGWLDTEGIGESLIADAAGRLRVFIAHGSQDTMVEFGAASEALEKLTGWGFDATFHEFDGGHTVPEEILQLAEEWMKNPPAEEK